MYTKELVITPAPRNLYNKLHNMIPFSHISKSLDFRCTN